MLRDFGLVTVIDLAVSLLGVLAVLPAVLVARRAPPARRGPPSLGAPLAALSRYEGRAARADARGLRGRAARVDHAELGGDRDGGVEGAAGGGRAAAVRDAAVDVAVPRALRRERRDRGRPGRGGRKPACEVRGADVLNSCELAEGGPFVLAFVFEPVARCREQIPRARAGGGAPPRRQVPDRRRALRRRRRPLAGLQPAGRLRPRRRGRERVRGRRLPDDHLRAARREGRGLDGRAARRGRARGLGAPDCAAEPPIASGRRSRAARRPARLVRLHGRAQPAAPLLARAAPAPARAVGPPRRRARDHPGHARDPARPTGSSPGAWASSAAARPRS